MRQRGANAAALAVLAASMCVPGRALAYEDQITLGLGVGYAHAISPAYGHAPGVITDLSASVGLSQAWTLRGRLAYAAHPEAPALHAVLGAGELLYLVDIVEFVPYAGLGLGVFGGTWGADAAIVPAAHVVGGCDYLLTRALALEIDLRAVLWPASLEGDRAYFAAVLSGVLMLDR